MCSSTPIAAPTRSNAARTPQNVELLGASGPLRRSLLYAVLYADLFDHVLTLDELERYRPLVPSDSPEDQFEDETVPDALAALLRGCLVKKGPFVCWRGREGLADLRTERHRSAAPKWERARRFARVAWHIPFTRMVAVCGSLALDNVETDADIDVMVVASPGRLWVVHALVMLAKRVLSRRGSAICPNFLLTEDHLAVAGHSLYRAREVAHVVPLQGLATYQRFVEANLWIWGFLPALDLTDRSRRLDVEMQLRSKAWAERALGGRFGGAIDRTLHAVLSRYFTLRWRRFATVGSEVKEAYQRHRQEVVGGGYAGHIQRAFEARVFDYLGASPRVLADLRVLFPPSPDPRSGTTPDGDEARGPDAHFRSEFERKYGVAR